MFSSHRMHWDIALILVFLAAAIPLLGRRRIRQLMQRPETTKRDRLSLYASTIAFQWLGVALILWRASAHRIPPGRMGIALPNVALAATVSVALSLVVLLNQILSLKRLAQRPSEIGGILPQLGLKIFPQDSVERLCFFAVVLTVSLCEELIYRGFALAVLSDWLGAGRFWVAGIAASSALFALGHAYQGRRGIIATFVVGMLFATARVWTGSLIPAMVAHFTADWTVGLIAPPLLRAALERPSTDNAAREVNVGP
jgi:membrane protease YdiL (CAAX protease family)